MAHHNSTPRTVLDAPSRTRRWVVEYTSANRAGRRHLVLKSGRRLRLPFVPLGLDAPNQPYRRPRKRAQS